AFYNLYLHPLRAFPGPWSTRAGVLWHSCHSLRGDPQYALHQMHLKYGPTIRIAPDKLIFVDAKALKDIYGHRNGTPEYIKDPSLTFIADAGPSLFSVPKDDHSKLRRLLSHRFSDRALREQESVISGYANLLARSATIQPGNLS
ncbi:hypothetical protein COCSADRAFT_81587, partial [Bipolaris sorokiniana ND90Pr]